MDSSSVNNSTNSSNYDYSYYYNYGSYYNPSAYPANTASPCQSTSFNSSSDSSFDTSSSIYSNYNASYPGYNYNYNYYGYNYNTQPSPYTSSPQYVSPATCLSPPLAYSSYSTETNSSTTSAEQEPSNIESYNPQLAVPLATTPVKPKTAKVAKKHPHLPEEAVDILNEWFNDHINNPYPTSEEKERLAVQCGITAKQVNSWICNRRNRSQNTRPKRLRRQFEKELGTLMSELEKNNQYSNSQHLIQKLSQYANQY